jgi:hypothetical protein
MPAPRLCVRSGGRLFIANQNKPGERMWLDVAFCSYKPVQVTVPSSGVNNSHVISGACFHRSLRGTKTWFSAADIYKALGLSVCGGSASKWLHQKLGMWERLAKTLWLSEDAVKRSMPYKKDCCE